MKTEGRRERGLLRLALVLAATLATGFARAVVPESPQRPAAPDPSLVSDLVLNGEKLGPLWFFPREPADESLISLPQLATLLEARLKSEALIELRGQFPPSLQLVRVADLARHQIEIRFSQTSFEVEIVVPAERLSERQLGDALPEEASPELSTAPAEFSALVTGTLQGEAGPARAALPHELVFNWRHWTLEHQGAWNISDQQLERRYDLLSYLPGPETHLAVRAGDLNVPFSLRSLAFQGAQISYRHSTDPYPVSQRLKKRPLFLERPSLIRIFENDVEVQSYRVPAGPVVISSLITRRSTQRRIVIEDDLGRRQEFTETGLVAPSTLEEGQWSLLAQAGATRSDPQGLGSAEFGYGISSWMNAGVSAVIAKSFRQYSPFVLAENRLGSLELRLHHYRGSAASSWFEGTFESNDFPVPVLGPLHGSISGTRRVQGLAATDETPLMQEIRAGLSVAPWDSTQLGFEMGSSEFYDLEGAKRWGVQWSLEAYQGFGNGDWDLSMNLGQRQGQWNGFVTLSLHPLERKHSGQLSVERHGDSAALVNLAARKDWESTSADLHAESQFSTTPAEHTGLMRMQGEVEFARSTWRALGSYQQPGSWSGAGSVSTTWIWTPLCNGFSRPVLQSAVLYCPEDSAAEWELASGSIGRKDFERATSVGMPVSAYVHSQFSVATKNSSKAPILYSARSAYRSVSALRSRSSHDRPFVRGQVRAKGHGTEADWVALVSGRIVDAQGESVELVFTNAEGRFEAALLEGGHDYELILDLDEPVHVPLHLPRQTGADVIDLGILEERADAN